MLALLLVMLAGVVTFVKAEDDVRYLSLADDDWLDASDVDDKDLLDFYVDLE